MLKQKNPQKVSLNIKVTPELNERLKNVRARARNNDMIFNVSEEVINFLEKRVKRAEKELDEIEKPFKDHPALKEEDNSIPSEVEKKSTQEDFLNDIPSFTQKGDKK